MQTPLNGLSWGCRLGVAKENGLVKPHLVLIMHNTPGASEVEEDTLRDKWAVI